mmetsp:Transcript_44048/g.93777  ORF Transcript_44048/g.93777 Transcript_44048/m.93777 type:complete len:81 (-) Transcript_44048:754-996(-)
MQLLPERKKIAAYRTLCCELFLPFHETPYTRARRTNNNLNPPTIQGVLGPKTQRQNDISTFPGRGFWSPECIQVNWKRLQ